jgi:hypothetical protein
MRPISKSMYKSYARTLLFLFACFAAVGAFADSFDAKVASVILLQLKPVQKEIGLTEGQRTAMNKFADAHRAKLKAYYDQLGNSGQPNEQKLLTFFEAMKAGVLSQLTPPQLKRLREISLQALDFTALADHVVADEVGLSASQQVKVKQVVTVGVTRANDIRNTAVNKATGDLVKQKPKTEKEQQALSDEYNRRAEAATDRVSSQLNQIRESTRQQVMALLTSTEHAKWEMLLGKRFSM